MRNAVPRFGMRWAVVLAVVAAVALAALLAVGSPASAQSSDDGEEIWSATMTVGDFPMAKGYGQPSSVGSLSDDTFILGQHEFQVNGILDRQIGSRLIVGFAPRQPNDGELRAMTLHLGGRSFAFEDATYASDTTYTHVYSWPLSPRFGWTAGERVAVSINALPMVEVYANDSEVEYGGSGNTDDATIEFSFNRIGSTDEALSFNFSFVQTGETATRTFQAGQEYFYLYHWVIEVDESNNPLCTITWEVLPGDGYVLGRDPIAAVDVEGPGTICMSGM